MNRNILVYVSYLAILAVITISIKYFGLPLKSGLWAALGIACVYAAFWPRWG